MLLSSFFHSRFNRFRSELDAGFLLGVKFFFFFLDVLDVSIDRYRGVHTLSSTFSSTVFLSARCAGDAHG
jgi:hypothetical protein